MLVLRNMDELMEMELDGPEMEGKGNKVFAAGHACVCNPLKKPHYPKDWYVSPLPSPVSTAYTELECVRDATLSGVQKKKSQS